MAIKAVFFDLDDTLIYEKSSADEALIATARFINNEYNIDPDIFVEKLKKNARKLWHSLPTYPYCLKIGISSWEELWAIFIGKHEMLKQLALYAKTYQFEAWNMTLKDFSITVMLFRAQMI